MSAFTRTLVAALAILALAAPVASARPLIDPPLSQPPSHGAVYWSYDYQAPKPASHPPVPAPVHATTTSDDDIPWLAIGFGVAGVFLLVSAVAAGVAVTRRPREAGIA